MGMRCVICSHSKKLEIEKEIIRGTAHTKIAKIYGVSNLSVRNHTMNHLSRQLVKHKETRELLHSNNLLNEIEDLLEKSKSILEKAESEGKLNTALNAIRQTRATIELLCKLATYMKDVQQKDEQEERRIEVDKLNNLSVKELKLLSELRRKAESGGGGKEILGLPWEIVLEQDDIYLYGQVMETIKYEKEIRERHDAGEIFYYEEEQEKKKARIRKRMKLHFGGDEPKKKENEEIKWDFEDEKKEETGEDDGAGEGGKHEESTKAGETKKGKAKGKALKDTDSIQGRDMCPGLSSIGKTRDGRTVFDL